MCFKKAVAKSSRFSRIFAFGLMIFSGAGLINLCTVCAETTDDLQGPPVAQSHIIGIDPGHQGPNVDMSDLEPLGPGSTEMKAKASTGTQGTFSGLPEYQLNLDVSLKLQQILEDRGYQTVLTRTDNDTAISNKERAEYVAGQGADICVRIHANGAESSSAAGALTISPSSSNPYVSQLYDDSNILSQFILDHSNLCSFHIFQKIPEDRRLAGSQKSRQKIQFNLTHDSFLLFLYCNCTLICSAAAATYFSSFSVLQLQFKSPA